MIVFATVGQTGRLEIGTLRKCITGIRKRKKCLQRTNLFQIILKKKRLTSEKVLVSCSNKCEEVFEGVSLWMQTKYLQLISKTVISRLTECRLRSLTMQLTNENLREMVSLWSWRFDLYCFFRARCFICPRRRGRRKVQFKWVCVHDQYLFAEIDN